MGAHVLLPVLVVLMLHCKFLLRKQFHRSDRNEFIDPAPFVSCHYNLIRKQGMAKFCPEQLDCVALSGRTVSKMKVQKHTFILISDLRTVCGIFVLWVRG